MKTVATPWKFGTQALSGADQHKFGFNILNGTKVWPEDSVPVRYMCLNRNVDELFAATEQIAFCTNHVVPAMLSHIGLSNDPLLQGRNFSCRIRRPDLVSASTGSR